ncbi:alanine racemase [Labedella phragmitis]|uniref:Alanine racemase n=1 Tax=Labedella phragmitis TaxID=2498849 RepID=A0A3S3ZWF0_9MICO|nr:alanine racemase [Labedella phragmitis]RWZ46175.1 alanine racemase [Labedella phragmitis]
MHDGSRLLIDDGAVARNVRRIVRSTGTPLMAVLKADAFGHGPQAAVVLSAGASWIGVTSIKEAMPLREHGVRAPLLSWLNPVDADWAAAIAADIDLAVPGVRHLSAIAGAAVAAGRRARVHLHLDVGMARDGAASAEWKQLMFFAREWEERGAIRVVGIMAHLSSAQDPEAEENVVERQRFLNGCRMAARAGLRPSVRHLAATAAALSRPDTRFDLTRVGAGLFGIDPAHRFALEGAMTLDAPVVSVRDVRAGTGVGYGLSHHTDRDTRLALVPIGYGDGIPRAASHHASVSIRGVRRPVVGLISMDQLVVDTGDVPVTEGERAVVFGPGNDGEPTVRDWADWAGTIEHEIVTGLGPRIRREHRGVSTDGTSIGDGVDDGRVTAGVDDRGPGGPEQPRHPAARASSSTPAGDSAAESAPVPASAHVSAHVAASGRADTRTDLAGRSL